MTTSLARPIAPTLPAVRRQLARRVALVSGVLAVLLAAIVAVSLGTGAYPISPERILPTLLGAGESKDAFVLFRLRLPRIVLGVLAGVAFGIAGALFQTLLRNPLASPDIIGISGGASAAAAFGILILGVSGAMVSLLAFGGAVAVALAITLLASREGLSGYRFVLVGVGFAFLAQSVIGYLLTRADEQEAVAALAWTVGGVAGARWDDIGVIAVTLVPLLLFLAALVPRIRTLQLGDDTATGLGLRVVSARYGVLAVAVALTAVATAYAGPLAFVAFVSAPIARRLVGGAHLAIIPAALIGAIVVTFADFAASTLIPGVVVPAGIVTGIIGAPYLLWLLATSNRGRRNA
nr:iron ABC transporter permease [Salinibacterium sp.]